MKRKLNVLIACEESQACCRAFRKLGHNAYSCDLFECSGTIFGTDIAEPHPEWHFNHDITTVLNKTDLTLQNGEQAVYPNRAKDREDGANFFLFLAGADIKRIAIENPVGIMSTRWRKPDQAIQPFMFGDPYSKNTCLWIKNLRPLHPSKPTDDQGERIYFGSGKSQPKWYSDGFTKTKTPEERQKWRSKTFPNIARVIAEQWTIQIAAEEDLLDEKEWIILGHNYLELLDKMTGGIRYSSAKVDSNIEKHKYPIHFKQDLLDEIEEREQSLIQYWEEH